VTSVSNRCWELAVLKPAVIATDLNIPFNDNYLIEKEHVRHFQLYNAAVKSVKMLFTFYMLMSHDVNRCFFKES